jgi:iron complex transport system ATP-binding protein
MLNANNLSTAYGQQNILEQISFSLKRGEILGVIGPNGVGKSTLIRTISGINPLRTGEISIDKQDLSQLSQTERAKLMAVVPQAINLPSAFTVWQTVLLGRTPHLNWLGQLSKHDEEIAIHAMERTNTLHLKERRVGEISGGEQQRILLARALVQSAPFLLLDEPTSHLDLKYQYELLNTVRDLVRQDQLAALIVLHDLNLAARYTDRILLLVGGKIYAHGAPKEVLTSENLSFAYQIPLAVKTNGAVNNLFIAPIDQQPANT